MSLAPGEYVFVARLFDADPVMHSWRRVDLGLTNDRTQCGLRQTARPYLHLVSMPKAHAERFCRLCRRCWPETPGRPTV